jgi:LysM domain-containing protein
MQPTKAVLILMSFFLAKLACAQSDELIVHGQTGKLFLEHTVVAKENWYSVGRLYNVSPKVLAPYNKSTLGKPLVIGERLEIPLGETNFSQNGAKGAGETLVPVFYVTQEKEWMYRISVNHNKVPYASIEKWNDITADQIHPGMHLIVGYLKVKTALSALATRKPEAVAERPAQAISTLADSPKAVMSSKPAPAAATRPVTEPKRETEPPATGGVSDQTVVTKPVAEVKTTAAIPHFNGGVFGADYSDGGKSATGMAGIFKSTSGWQDGKYYALMNNVAVGTIVRVTDPTTSKNIYAKVLGQLPDMKESNGLIIRISNAAAAELGAGDGKFNVLVNY